jgi:hypothetical protein
MRASHASILLALAFCLAASIERALAGDAPPIFAQQLVEETKASHSNVVTIGIHAKPPGTSDYFIIAHTNLTSVGHKSEGADLVTLATGQTDGPNPLPGGVFDVGVPLKDQAGRTVGFVAVHVHPDADSKDPKRAALRSVLKLRDEMAHKIPSEVALFKARR